MKLVSLQFDTIKGEHQKNLDKLLSLVDKTEQNSLIVAPEVCLSGFDYDNYEQSLEFAKIATDELKKASQDKIIITTMMEREDEHKYNFVKVFYKGEVVFQRAKAKLFRFGDEHKYMSEGSSDEVKIIEINGIKLGVLICFELRFKELWKKLEGCDVIVVPSWWGVLRSEHFRVLTEALAVMNQCYVVASDSLNESCTKLSGIIRPHGEVLRNAKNESLSLLYDKKEVLKMRRYLDVGIG
ncbi:MAG: carbon-nitrogen hydrolase family protein [Sulfurimonadaceae bacterium]|nr:carbon-nitrogen hydrolase family protein [Sulfurimonadaceae bacterium]